MNAYFLQHFKYNENIIKYNSYNKYKKYNIKYNKNYLKSQGFNKCIQYANILKNGILDRRFYFAQTMFYIDLIFLRIKCE